MDEGTANVAVKEPVAEVVTVVGEVETIVPSYLMVIVEEAANPLPVTLTLEPVMLLVGLALIDALTMKVVEAVSEATSEDRIV